MRPVIGAAHGEAVDKAAAQTELHRMIGARAAVGEVPDGAEFGFGPDLGAIGIDACTDIGDALLRQMPAEDSYISSLTHKLERKSLLH